MIMDKTGAKIVLSTFWRKWKRYIAYVLSRYGIDPKSIVDITPGRGHIKKEVAPIIYESRSAEILAWLSMNGFPRSFVILDDREYAGLGVLKSRFILTGSDVGITNEQAGQALKILQLPCKKDDPVAKWLEVNGAPKPHSCKTIEGKERIE
mmetsp:Transcript_25372/g.61110  ORF Transcript_25372/g.61110 Transcript_25372/m.61110 type:complete len:151 (+) Transcript_25372:223-675(+)